MMAPGGVGGGGNPNSNVGKKVTYMKDDSTGAMREEATSNDTAAAPSAAGGDAPDRDRAPAPRSAWEAYQLEVAQEEATAAEAGRRRNDAPVDAPTEGDGEMEEATYGTGDEGEQGQQAPSASASSAPWHQADSAGADPSNGEFLHYQRQHRDLSQESYLQMMYEHSASANNDGDARKTDGAASINASEDRPSGAVSAADVVAATATIDAYLRDRGTGRGKASSAPWHQDDSAGNEDLLAAAATIDAYLRDRGINRGKAEVSARALLSVDGRSKEARGKDGKDRTGDSPTEDQGVDVGEGDRRLQKKRGRPLKGKERKSKDGAKDIGTVGTKQGDDSPKKPPAAGGPTVPADGRPKKRCRPPEGREEEVEADVASALNAEREDDRPKKRSSRGEALWEERFARLRAYSKANGGDANVPEGGESGDGELFLWAKKQRSLHRKGALDDRRASRLESIGFDFTAVRPLEDIEWDKMYSNLVDYHEQNGHCYVPQSYTSERHGDLGSWVQQTRDVANGTLTDAATLSSRRREKLNELGFDFKVTSGIDWEQRRRWETRLKELIEYKAENKGADPPHRSKGVGYWSCQQRRLYRDGKLPRDHIVKLMNVGFDFRADRGMDPQSRQEIWDKMLQRYVQYKKMNDGEEPKKRSEPSLYNWCSEQRNQYHFGRLSQSNIQKLRDAGLNFARRRKASWNAALEELTEYISENGSPPPSDSKGLGYWCRTQRRSYQSERMPYDRFVQLLEAGFDFEDGNSGAEGRRWEERFSQLLDHKSGHGGEDPPVTSKGIGFWCACQRQKYRDGTMAQERIDRLKGAGFRFDIEHGRAASNHPDVVCDGDEPNSSTNPRLEEYAKLWESNYALLVEFHKVHGHCRVKRSDNQPVLQRWVKSQRERGKKGRISEDRIRKLEALNFQFSINLRRRVANENACDSPEAKSDCRDNNAEKGPEREVGASDDQDSAWQSQYHVLTAYIQQHGHPPRTREENPALYDWVVGQKERQDQIKQLLTSS